MKNLFYLLAIVCSISLFAACSSDDDESPVAGTYSGTLTVTTPAGALAPVSQDVKVADQGSNMALVSINNFSINEVNVGLVEASCTVTQNGDAYRLSGTAKAMGADVTLNGTVNGSALALNIDVPAFHVTAVYSGTKK